MTNITFRYKVGFSGIVILLISILVLSLSACKSTSKISTYTSDLSAIYNPAKSDLHPSYKIYHNSSNTSILYVKVFLDELSFQPLGPDYSEISKVELKLSLLEIGSDSTFISDTSSFKFQIDKQSDKTFYIKQIPINTKMGYSYRIKLEFIDLIRKRSNVTFIEAEKIENEASQFFNLTDLNNVPLFKNILNNNEAIRIWHAQPCPDTIFILYYSPDTVLPKPTYAVSPKFQATRKPDSVYVVKYSNNTALNFVMQGYYFIQFDTSSNYGVTVSRFEEGFPRVTTPEMLIKPLVYITTVAEYKKLISSTNNKLTADNFWINAGGNESRGKELIRIYYNRVYFANYYFSNLKPGWQTDRGMVYIVYGPPNKLEKTSNSEIWYYNNKRTKEPIKFTFTYSPNKFNLNEFALNRSENHTWHWREAIYYWTSGELFTNN